MDACLDEAGVVGFGGVERERVAVDVDVQGVGEIGEEGKAFGGGEVEAGEGD